jgi:hypothetical protein
MPGNSADEGAEGSTIHVRKDIAARGKNPSASAGRRPLDSPPEATPAARPAGRNPADGRGRASDPVRGPVKPRRRPPVREKSRVVRTRIPHRELRQQALVRLRGRARGERGPYTPRGWNQGPGGNPGTVDGPNHARQSRRADCAREPSSSLVSVRALARNPSIKTPPSIADEILNWTPASHARRGLCTPSSTPDRNSGEGRGSSEESLPARRRERARGTDRLGGGGLQATLRRGRQTSTPTELEPRRENPGGRPPTHRGKAKASIVCTRIALRQFVSSSSLSGFAFREPRLALGGPPEQGNEE